jgi:prevent-host-death family protein
MINMDNIRPLTEFKRRTAEFRERLRRTGLPTVLTVEGRPELVVQDAAAYQKMLDLFDRADTLEGVRKGLVSLKAGEGTPLEEMDARLRRKHRIPRGKA